MITVPSGSIVTVQQGVDAAGPGDTVLVHPGTYSNPDVAQYWPPVVYIGHDKPGLKLRAVGRPGSVKIVGPGLGRGIWIEGPNVLVEGFDISGFETGILGTYASGARITGNQIHGCVNESITLRDASTDCEIDRNSLDGGQTGIFLSESTRVYVHHNSIAYASRDGIFLALSTDCWIEHNEVNDNEYFGILLSASANATVNQNEASNNRYVGIVLDGSPNSQVVGNRTNNNGNLGIFVVGSCGSSFERNSAEGNGAFDLVVGEWVSPATCNTYSNNRASTALPSLALWDAE